MPTTRRERVVTETEPRREQSVRHDDQQQQRERARQEQEEKEDFQEMLSIHVKSSQSKSFTNSPPSSTHRYVSRKLRASSVSSTSSSCSSLASSFIGYTRNTRANSHASPPTSSSSTCSSYLSNSPVQKRLLYHQIKEKDLDQMCNRNRRACSAEYQLSLLQQELGYSQLPLCSSQPPNSSSSTTSTTSSSACSFSGGSRGPLSRSFIVKSSSSTASTSSGRRRGGNWSFTASSRSSRLSEDDNLSFLEAINAIVNQPTASRSSSHQQDSDEEEDKLTLTGAQDIHDQQRISEEDKPSSLVTVAEPEQEQELSREVKEEPAEVDDEDDERDESEDNFLDYRIASVTGFTRGRDGVVYYEILVESVLFGPLSSYKVRRRYSEFRELHRRLATIMAGNCDSSELNELLAMSSWHENDLEQTSSRVSSIRSTMSNAENSQRLPPLPDHGGLWSFMMGNSNNFLRKRAKYFDAMILAAQNHEGARQSGVLTEFLGAPPDCVARDTSGGENYVSLSRFAAPKLRLSVEAHERKQVAKNISIKRTGKSPR